MGQSQLITEGLILFAHGSRDPLWKKPLERLYEKLDANPQAHHLKISLAFLEHLLPSLPDAVESLVKQGCTKITIVPIFLGHGGHIRRDLGQLMHELKNNFPDIQLYAAQAAGEDDGVIDALAMYCLHALTENVLTARD